MRLVLFVFLLLATASQAAPRQATPGWRRFTAILWQSDLPSAALAALPRLGITAGRVFGQRGPLDPAALQASVAVQRRAGLATMVENVATDFYAAYHRWQSGIPVNAAFQDLLARYHADPVNPALWQRDPGLADPAALAVVGRRLMAHARILAATPPLYISLGDETGIADLSAASDLDQSEAVLRGWRAELRRRYGRIEALNRAWQSQYRTWDAVRPTSTDAALNGVAPVAAWLDFKAWMDRVFARAVHQGTTAVHAGAPHMLAAIEGAQRPGWGGYDYATLAPAIDVMEAGEPSSSFALGRGFNPHIVLLTTALPDAADANRLWRSVLLGGSGAVLWDADGTVMQADGTPGPNGIALAPVLAGLRGPLGTILIAARPQRSTVGLLYSQASFRMRWLLDRRTERQAGQDWTTRDNDTDLADSPWRLALTDTAAALDHLGVHPDYLDEAALTPARLAGLHTVLLPQSIVLSGSAVAVLRRFAAAGGTILADVEPGQYDALGGARTALPLAGLGQRLGRFDTAGLRRALHAPAIVTTPDGAARDDVSVFRLNPGTMLALHADAAAGAGPAMVSVGGRRCLVSLDAAIPTVLVRGVRGLSILAADGTRRLATCRGATGVSRVQPNQPSQARRQ